MGPTALLPRRDTLRTVKIWGQRLHRFWAPSVSSVFPELQLSACCFQNFLPHPHAACTIIYRPFTYIDSLSELLCLL